MMIVCEFCTHCEQEGQCGLRLKLPKRMRCRAFEPGLGKFCAEAKDFVSLHQITEMATFFGLNGMELKKVKLMAAREESRRR
jgi:hypothetical protein